MERCVTGCVCIDSTYIYLCTVQSVCIVCVRNISLLVVRPLQLNYVSQAKANYS